MSCALVIPGRWKGKQLIAPGPKKPAGVAVGYFDKFTYTPETYVDRSREFWHNCVVCMPAWDGDGCVCVCGGGGVAVG